MPNAYIEKVKEANTPDEMRAELNRLSMHDPLIRNVFNSSDYNGLSGEDRFTVLAYFAIKHLNETRQREIDFMMTQPVKVMTTLNT